MFEIELQMVLANVAWAEGGRIRKNTVQGARFCSGNHNAFAGLVWHWPLEKSVVCRISCLRSKIMLA